MSEKPEVWAGPENNDALVAFTQTDTAAKDPSKRQVACWLSSWPEPTAVGEPAVRRMVESNPQLTRLSVLESPEQDEPSPLDADRYAVWENQTGEMVVHLGQESLGPVELPTAHEDRKTVSRILLTPLGVAGDAVILAGAIMLVGLSSGMCAQM